MNPTLLLLQLDAGAAGEIVGHMPSTPWAVAGALAVALVLMAVYVLRDKFGAVPVQEAHVPPIPQMETPSCKLDHSQINTRLQFLERDVAEIRAMHKESIEVARDAAEAIREAVRLLQSLSTATAQSAQVLHQSITSQSTSIPLWAQQVINELRTKRADH